jgi:hypothetical protein
VSRSAVDAAENKAADDKRTLRLPVHLLQLMSVSNAACPNANCNQHCWRMANSTVVTCACRVLMMGPADNQDISSIYKSVLASLTPPEPDPPPNSTKEVHCISQASCHQRTCVTYIYQFQA